MKFKFLSILMAVAVALAFSSCKNETSGSDSGSPSGNEDKNNTEKVEKTNASEEAIEMNEPEAQPMASANDPTKDAKVYVDKVLALAEGISSEEDNKKAEETIKKMDEDLKKAYKDKPEEFAKLEAEVQKLMDSKEFKERMDKAYKAYQEKVK